MQTTHNDTAVSAIAMAVGLNFGANQEMLSKFAEDCGMGMLEFYGALGEDAELSAKLVNAIYACPDFAEVSFPGVYAYEVDEEYGAELARRIALSADVTPEVMRPILGMLAADFFSQCNDAPYALSIIKDMTGYDSAADERLWTLTVQKDNGAGEQQSMHVWYFDLAEQAAKAREFAHAPGSGVVVAGVRRCTEADMPKDEIIASADEFRDWLIGEDAALAEAEARQDARDGVPALAHVQDLSEDDDESKRYRVTMRSKTTHGTDTETLTVHAGQDVEAEATRVAAGYGAKVEKVEPLND
jgi:hypothetical protein